MVPPTGVSFRTFLTRATIFRKYLLLDELAINFYVKEKAETQVTSSQNQRYAEYKWLIWQ